MMRMMATPDQVTGPINIGNPVEFSMLELAEQVIALTGSRCRIVNKPLPADDPKQRRPDIELARKELGGWEPTVASTKGCAVPSHYFRRSLPQAA